MSLKSTHDTTNLVVEEDLTVTYSDAIIQGTWGYTSANVSGWYTRMREVHRRATKAFRYVGMTHTAATSCKTAMISAFTRTYSISVWNDGVMGGNWDVISGGSILMADVSCVHSDDDGWDVIVRVMEDDVRVIKTTDSYNANVVFAAERQRGYNGETETVGQGAS